MIKSLKYIVVFFLPVIAFGCVKKNRFEIDTRKNRVEVSIHRFDRDLINLDTGNLLFSVKELYRNYPTFLKLYLNELDTVSITDTVGVSKVLKDFVSYPQTQEINQKTATVFADISGIEAEVSDAFTYIGHYFPGLTLPEVYFFVSGLSRRSMSDLQLKTLGIGSDFYLGADFEPYKSVVYDYMLSGMQTESLPVDLIANVVFNNFRFDSKENRLIDNMLYQGKALFLLSVLMPNRAQHEIVGYTEAQQKWAELQEKEIWKSIVSQKDLFTTNQHIIRKYMQDAPFTAPISQDSPGRLGEWMGLRIVESYMKNNKKVTLPELMQMRDYLEMLAKSGY